MFYKGKKDRITRALRRLYEVEIYDGDPDDKKTKTHIETVIAWNEVDALRRCPGKAAKQPKAVCFVTWDDKPQVIHSTAGPEDEVVEPTIAPPEEDWSNPVLDEKD